MNAVASRLNPAAIARLKDGADIASVIGARVAMADFWGRAV